MGRLLFIARWVGLAIAAAIALLLFSAYLRGYFRAPLRYELQSPHIEDIQALAGFTGSSATQARPTALRIGARDIYNARLEAIREATQSILLETFNMAPGQWTARFADTLIERSRAGVDVFFLADAMGTRKMPDEYWRRLEAAGIEVRFYHTFDPRAPLEYVNRDHRKLLLVDRSRALIGGAGIADYWESEDEAGPVWLDLEALVEGPVVSVLEGFFWAHWTMTGGSARLAPNTGQSTGSPTLVTPSSFSLESSGLRRLLAALVTSARQRVWIASPYFLPAELTSGLLQQAASRGVDVRILTSGSKSNRPMVHLTSREGYGPLLRAGVRIYEYRPAMMHAKTLLVDEQWVSLGSANIDPRSLFENEELILSFSNRAFGEHLERFFIESFEDSHEVDIAQWRDRPVWDRIRGRLGLCVFRFL